MNLDQFVKTAEQTSLTEQEAEALYRRVIQAESEEEIASEMEISEQTVREAVESGKRRVSKAEVFRTIVDLSESPDDELGIRRPRPPSFQQRSGVEFVKLATLADDINYFDRLNEGAETDGDWPQCRSCGAEMIGLSQINPETGEWTCQDCGHQFIPDEGDESKAAEMRDSYQRLWEQADKPDSSDVDPDRPR
jgi:hypothetical protein